MNNMLPISKFTIDRNKWYRGYGSNESALLQSDSEAMCCLGFLAMACGMEEHEIRGYGSPQDCHSAKWPKGLYSENQSPSEYDVLPRLSEVCKEIIEVNDNDSVWYTEDQREETLTELFKQLGIEVTFVTSEDGSNGK